MGGSGGGFIPSGSIQKVRQDLEKSIEKSKEITQQNEFETKVASVIGDTLVDFNKRDAELTSKRIEDVKKALGKEIDGTINLQFGGSVRKHTYVEGLSDIDSLVIINNTDLEGKSPEQVKEHFYKNLQKHIKGKEHIDVIKKTTLTVTLQYADGTEIQLLAAVKTADGIKIPSASGKRWSEVNPVGFTKHLTSTNEKLEGKLVPTIKLVKAINSRFPKESQMSGYHIESMAIEVFKNYSGEKTCKSLLAHFFNEAKSRVKSPIKDKTGQSVHVDDGLGSDNSEPRKAISYQLDQISRKIKSANNRLSAEEWKRIIGEVE